MSKDDMFGEVIQYLDGFAWGIAPAGSLVYLGQEDAIRKALEGRSRSGNKVVDQILAIEREAQKEISTKLKKEQAKVRAVRAERHRQAVKLGLARKTGSGKNKK